MAKSLLAHLYSHIRGSQEDIATMSLQYIITQHVGLRLGFNHLIGAKLHVGLSDVTKYTCQATGDGLERPDLSGTDVNGNELILCEAKFYAGLTANQPGAYLARLKEEEGKGLVFICPEARITSLWGKLLSLCDDDETEVVDRTCVRVSSIPMAIITWDEILSELLRIAHASVPAAVSDLEQLDGFCKAMDKEAFIPFEAEELGILTARKQQRFYQVIDKTVDLILSDPDLDASRIGKNSTYFGGYERKFRLATCECNLAYDEKMWMSDSSIESPFWLAIKDSEGYQNGSLLEKIHMLPDIQVEDNVWTMHYIGLQPLTNSTLDEVAEDLKAQIMYHVKRCDFI